ncbi:uncharacterized protein LOC122536888 [Frieseomelitta varia]|uniref:uncharacterized protein LOC122536888 n=1 Tax=Frieseomelitta varia TaxID=561572 RepID=UPI001CB6B16F|nr:uncharacterized protein LOC122536888 [Frieseomelitta varia]
MSRGRREIRLSRPIGGRPAANVDSVEEDRVAERLRRIRRSSMLCHDLMGRVMSRVVGTLLARSTLLTSVAAALVVLFCCCRCTRASEFPERECCDLIFPIPEPTGRSTSAPTPTGRSGSDIKVPVAILNCLYARQLCFEDPSCSAILEIIPRVCGPELGECQVNYSFKFLLNRC